MSNIATYLKQKNISVPSFAKQLGVHKTTVYNWLNNKKPPGVRIAKRIVHLTEGELTLDDIFS